MTNMIHLDLTFASLETMTGASGKLTHRRGSKVCGTRCGSWRCELLMDQTIWTFIFTLETCIYYIYFVKQHQFFFLNEVLMKQ